MWSDGVYPPPPPQHPPQHGRVASFKYTPDWRRLFQRCILECRDGSENIGNQLCLETGLEFLGGYYKGLSLVGTIIRSYLRYSRQEENVVLAEYY